MSNNPNKDYRKDDPDTIQHMFGSIASDYDRGNAIMSCQLHKLWNASLVKPLLVAPDAPNVLLDLCCGTGDITFAYLKKCRNKCRVYMLDFCEEMLVVAQEKAKRLHLDHHDLSFLHADAQSIPLPNNSVDCVTIAYGIRNVKEPALCVQEVFRVLRPGGTFGILELTRPENPLLNICHTLYLKTMIPLIGRLATSNQNAYRYLCNSIQTFTSPPALEQILQKNGFEHTSRIPLTGGIATIISGLKPGIRRCVTPQTSLQASGIG